MTRFEQPSRLLVIPKNCTWIVLIVCLQIIVITAGRSTFGVNNNGDLFGLSQYNNPYINPNRNLYINEPRLITQQPQQGTNSILLSIRGGSTETTTTTTNDSVDFGAVLSKSYRVESTRIKKKNYLPILGGTFSEALQIARSHGRLLIIFIPSGKPNDKGVELDRLAITTFLSSELTKVAEGKARKSKTNNKNDDGTTTSKSQQTTPEVAGVSEQKSFVLWSTTNPTEIANVIKRVKGLQPKNPKTGTKRPVLAVLYPAISPSAPTTTIIPKLITQHHCSPPPNIETAVAWLQSIRKRSAPYYNKMQTDRIEAELYKQRLHGYKGSIESDIQRKQQEELVAQEQQQRELQRKAHIQKIQLRRQQLHKSLPDEPTATASGNNNNKNIITIALRFVDDKYVTKKNGATTQRRFIADETTLADVFNWIDVEFEIERELVVLQSMKGGASAQSYSWSDVDNENTAKSNDDEENDDDDDDDDDNKCSTKTLSELGFGKMTALRVTVETPNDSN